MIENILKITSRISLSAMGIPFKIRVEHDNEFANGRIFVQITYDSPCSKTGEVMEWHGRKWYLSKHMTTDEVVKTCYAAFEACVKHEVMEGFKVDDKPLFNPHVSFESLLEISDQEVMRLRKD